MYKQIIGIDPGKEGGIAALSREGELIAIGPLNELSPETFAKIASEADYQPTLVLIERAQAMPGQGVTSMFTYGTGFGRLLGWCEAFGLAHQLVPPVQWSRVMHAGTSGKDTKARSVQAAQRLFPGVVFTVGKSKRPHLGLVEALLIAAYGVRELV